MPSMARTPEPLTVLGMWRTIKNMAKVGSAEDIPAGTVIGVDAYAVGNNGEYFAVSRKCRHLRADLSKGTIDAEGCLVCPWHQAKYDVKTGRMVLGPQGAFAKVPGLGALFKSLTKVLPLKVAKVEERDGDVYLDD